MIHIYYKRHFNCFHGTTTSTFSLIEKENKFNYNKRDDHWLGNGVYFFLNDFEKANWWAENAVKVAARKIQKQVSTKIEPCTLYIEATTDSKKILDLNTENDQKKLHDFLLFLEEHQLNVNLKNLSIVEARCTTMDLLTKSEDYDASCYLFPNKHYQFKDLEKYGIVSNKGNQLCVYNQNIMDFSTLSKCEL